MRSPKLSLILCSRNDQYQGNAVWRLSTALNYVAEQARHLDRLKDLEIIVADWGSRRPLRDAVHLSPAAARLTSFLWIPPDLARQLQKDSPFPEVLALNAAACRARGDYIGRIDQDTLVGRGFLAWFFDAYLGGRTEVAGDAILLSNRRGIPYRFAAQCPALRAVTRYIDEWGETLPLAWPKPEHLYYQSPIGILLMHRTLWHGCHGYDETMIYFNYMEWDLVLRLRERFPFVNLGRLVNHDFFHLDHEHPLSHWGASGRKRKENPIRDDANPPPVFAPNEEDWGLGGNRLVGLQAAVADRNWEIASGSGRGSSRPGYRVLMARVRLRMWTDRTAIRLLNLVMAVPRFMVRRSPRLRAKAEAARDSVRQVPLYRWPGVLLAHLRSARGVARSQEADTTSGRGPATNGSLEGAKGNS